MINNLGQTDRMKQDYCIYSPPEPTALVRENEIGVIGEEEDIRPIRKRLEKKFSIDWEDIYTIQVI